MNSPAVMQRGDLRGEAVRLLMKRLEHVGILILDYDEGPLLDIAVAFRNESLLKGYWVNDTVYRLTVITKPEEYIYEAQEDFSEILRFLE